MACLDYRLQPFTEFIYGSVRRGLFITKVVKCTTTTSYDCFLNDDIEVAIANLWPTATIFTTTSDKLNPDVMLTRP